MGDVRRRWSPVRAGALLLGLALCGCGYSLVGTQRALPEYIRAISIPVFDNKTLEPGLEALVTNAVVVAFVDRGGVKVTENSPDARLSGAVVGYKAKPISYDREGNAEEYRISIQVDVELRDLHNGTLLFSASKLGVEKDYSVREDVSNLFRDAYGYNEADVHSREQSRQKALRLAARDLADKIASAVLDTF